MFWVLWVNICTLWQYISMMCNHISKIPPQNLPRQHKTTSETAEGRKSDGFDSS
jgi:hypothetical protein